MDPFDQQWHAAQSLADAGVLVDDAWARYLSLGGTADAAGVTAYLCGFLQLGDLQRDLITHAVEGLTQRPAPAHDPSITCPPTPAPPLTEPSISNDFNDGFRDDYGVPCCEGSCDETCDNSADRREVGASLLTTSGPGWQNHGSDRLWPALRVRVAAMFDPYDAELRRQESLRLTGLIPAGREERFDRFTREAKDRFGVVSAVITLVTDTEQIIKSTTGPLGADLPRETSFCTHTIKEDRAFVVLDTTDDDRFTTNPLVIGGPNLRFYAGIPLTGPGTWRIGALCLLDTQPRTFNEQDQRDLQNLADRVQAEILESGPRN